MADPSQIPMFDVTHVTPSSTVGNGIRKAYLCNSQIGMLKAGDLVLFYRSVDAKAITTLGIVENTLRSGDATTIAGFVGKRTVYSYKEIEGLASKTTLVLAILFRQIEHLSSPVSLTAWRTMGGSPYQSITKITDKQFANIMESGRADPS
jgi:hypothetical protein